MKKYAFCALLCMALFLAVAPNASASLTPGGLCSQAGSFADLETLGTCTIGDKTFSNFSYTSSTGSLTASSFLLESVDNAVGTPPLYGFEFAGLGLSGSADISIGWTVMVTNGSPLITSLHSQQVGGTTGTGTATIDEFYCLNASTVVGCKAPGVLNTIQSAGTNVIVNDATFAGVSELSVKKDIQVSTGTNGTAQLSAFSNDVDQTSPSGVPEPATISYLLGGAGLLALGWLRRKSTKS